ncbi:AGAP007150-PA-like protein [Anopheles sinensis]|uniref:AGAP007150-PA-like protein n=1 Tax=Anopheles sinensis TaxID=74873 RepID=A0A084WL02_ANOSI|nr:AGAP007150-PA-like protein [Anopheles sinensis]
MFAKLFIVAMVLACATAGLVDRPYSPVVARDGRAYSVYSSGVPVAQTYSTYSSDVPVYRTFSPFSASPVSYQTYSAPVVASPYYYV